MPLPSIKKVKKSWYLSSTCHSLGFAGLLFHRFFFWVLLKSVESSFIFDFHATRLLKITFFYFTLFDIKFGVLPFCKFIFLSFVFRRWAFLFSFSKLVFLGGYFDAAGALVLSSKILSLFRKGVRRVMLSHCYFFLSVLPTLFLVPML